MIVKISRTFVSSSGSQAVGLEIFVLECGGCVSTLSSKGDCSCSKETRRVGLLCSKFLAVCCAVKMLHKTIKLMVGHTAAAVLGTVYI